MESEEKQQNYIHQKRPSRPPGWIPPNKRPQKPNAADRRYFMEKAVNIVTAILSGIGFVSAMVFLATMG